MYISILKCIKGMSERQKDVSRSDEKRIIVVQGWIGTAMTPGRGGER